LGGPRHASGRSAPSAAHPSPRLGLSLASLPALTFLSRRWERAADRYSLDLTGDRAAYESPFRRLARANLSDLDPPRLLYLLLFTHPTPPERLAAAEAYYQ
jgi:Zn-dependent protease with chaperone function